MRPLHRSASATGCGDAESVGEAEVQYRDFSLQDDLSNVTLIIGDRKLHVHREILGTWSPVFKSMFVSSFRERDMAEIELPGKTVEDFQEFLYCMYPPIKPIAETTVHQLLPLAEEYQVMEVKKKCEEFLLTKPGSMKLLVTAQSYDLQALLRKCISQVCKWSLPEMQKDGYFEHVEAQNLIAILQARVQDLEEWSSTNRKVMSERDAKLFRCINDLVSGYGNFCTECKGRKVNEACLKCLQMYKEKVQAKCEEAKALRRDHPVFRAPVP